MCGGLAKSVRAKSDKCVIVRRRNCCKGVFLQFNSNAGWRTSETSPTPVFQLSREIAGEGIANKTLTHDEPALVVLAINKSGHLISPLKHTAKPKGP
jgi:hypothetical protein